jgi:hypothetical protein
MLFVFCLSLSAGTLLCADENSTASTDQTKDEQLRENQIKQAKLQMELAKTVMDRKRSDWLELKRLAEDDIVTGQEVNEAEEAYKKAESDLEQAKLELQRIEIESMRDAWHITITETRRWETADGKDMLGISIRNDSRSVRLEHTSEIMGEEVVVSAQINDIYVSIKDRFGAIIAQPYEIRVPSLKSKQTEPLEFELIKEDVQDVVVDLRYLDMMEDRNIHLKQEEPYISVIRTRKYKDLETGKRHLELQLKYGAIEEGVDAEGSDPSQLMAVEINNIYVSIRDETDAIVGTPYEIRIPSIKYHETVSLDYELRRNTNYVTVHMRYLNSEIRRNIYLEPDTRHISILSAVKYRQENNVFVRLILQNTTKGEMPSKSATPEEIAAANEIRGIYVSLLDHGVIIAKPYEYKIDLLGYNEKHTLEFQLHRDVEHVTVALDYKDTGIEERSVYLQKESVQDIVNVSSLRFSQEGNLGISVSYDLLLDRLAEDEKTFQLRVINLLDRISFEFTDPSTQSRMSQVKFTMEESRRNLSLVVYLPEELDINLLDKKMVFHVAVLDSEEAKSLGGTGNRITLTDEQIEGIKGGVERLELVPKGVPEFELAVYNYSFDIEKGESVELTVKLENTGTRNLDDIRMDITAEPDWLIVAEPMVVPKLLRNEETSVQLTITPSPDAAVSTYEVKVNASCTVDNQKVEAVEKILQVHVLSESRIGATTILIAFIVIVVLGMTIITVRVARR